ncbi:MAG: hypothetical protein HS128_23480 [Ideonella sp.]|nr:hypothetical protein [Ideonella sp.]
MVSELACLDRSRSNSTSKFISPSEHVSEQICGLLGCFALSGSAGSVKRGTGGEARGCDRVAQPTSAAASSSQGSSGARGLSGRGGALVLGSGMDGLQFGLQRVVGLDLQPQCFRGALGGPGALVGPLRALGGSIALLVRQLDGADVSAGREATAGADRQ